MNDDLMFDYLVQMGALRPDEAELKRRQAQVDALRKGAMSGPEGQMIGKHYVAPSMTQHLAQIAQGYMANKAQGGVDEQMRGMNERQRMALEQLRKRKMQPNYQAAPAGMDPYSNLPTYGNEA